MKKRLKSISLNNKLEFYTNEENIPNQNLVNDTLAYFSEGFGKRVFGPLEFFNLFYKQYEFIKNNYYNFEITISALRALGLNHLEKHVLFGLLLKWFGGYPVNFIVDEDMERIIKEIEKDFLAYPEQTPEKEFCRANMQKAKKFMKLGVALSASLNSDVDAGEILSAIDELQKPKEKRYNNFEELFDEAAREGLCGKHDNQQVYLVNRSLNQFNFNVWLQTTKQQEYGNVDQYLTSLTRENFVEFLKFDKAENDTRRFAYTTPENAFQTFIVNNNALRDKFRVKRNASKEDVAQMPRLNEGDILEFDPEYKTTLEAYTLLTEYYAKSYLELEKNLFIDTYKVWNEETITAEISEIEKFIEQANTYNLTEACKAYGSVDKDNLWFVYKRFKGGYYQNLEIKNYPMIGCVGNDEAKIYGRYFLFYKYLKDKVAVLENSNSMNDSHVNTTTSENNFLHSTIEDWLFEFKEKMSVVDYNLLVSALKQYFTSGLFPVLSNRIKVNGRVNKKLFGWALNQIYRVAVKGNLSKEYLLFAKHNISLFTDVTFDENDILNSNLYKYFTTKTQYR